MRVPVLLRASSTLFLGTLAVIVMQMFIAVINENFDVAEEAKKGRQASNYWASQRQEKTHTSWTKKLNPYRWFAPAPKAIAVDNLPSSLVLPMQKALVQDYSAPKREPSNKVYPILLDFKPSLIAYRHLPMRRNVQGITHRARSRPYKPFLSVHRPRPKCPSPTSRTYAGTARFHQTATTTKWKAICM